MRLPRFDHPLHLVAGQTIWLAWFGAVYGGMSVACAAWPQAAGAGPVNAINLALLAFSLLTAALLGWATRAAWGTAARVGGGRERFVARAAAFLYGASALATLLVAAPLLALPPCL
ncbi:hypothetical protein JI739_03120 [Ramlibacter sp. AW1]|uniref:Uncharacterized protein n=1 Tax=Ramlibacter aurantiacus TaxID=2801330 RepID=A0A937D614_9BURK|nr:hypothetical protein [Ramlibacter aurantiacus]MBL0419331.1 hypothetical protein [Ramlibacter aurantiacus]